MAPLGSDNLDPTAARRLLRERPEGGRVGRTAHQCLVVLALTCIAPALSRAVEVPHTFVNGEIADANQVNANFRAVGDAVANLAANVSVATTAGLGSTLRVIPWTRVRGPGGPSLRGLESCDDTQPLPSLPDTPAPGPGVVMSIAASWSSCRRYEPPLAGVELEIDGHTSFVSLSEGHGEWFESEVLCDDELKRLCYWGDALLLFIPPIRFERSFNYRYVGNISSGAVSVMGGSLLSTDEPPGGTTPGSDPVPTRTPFPSSTPQPTYTPNATWAAEAVATQTARQAARATAAQAATATVAAAQTATARPSVTPTPQNTFRPPNTIAPYPF